MTVRTFNYTGRRDLPKSVAEVQLREGPPLSFDAVVNLQDRKLPPDSLVFLEAESGRWSQRFPWGTVAAPLPASDRTLTDTGGEAIHFRVKVVAPPGATNAGRLLAQADNIRPAEGKGNRVPLLPVRPIDLQDAVWRLEIDDHGPALQVNKLIPNILERVRVEPLFFSLVFPEALRRTLIHILLELRSPPGDLDSGDPDSWGWQNDWLRFGRRHASEVPPTYNDDSPEQSTVDIQLWVDSAVMGFCSHHQVRRRFESVPLIEAEDS